MEAIKDLLHPLEVVSGSNDSDKDPNTELMIRNSLVLKYANESFQNDTNFVMKALKKNSTA